MNLPTAFRSQVWWVGVVVGVLSTVTVAALVFFTLPWLLPFVLGWPLLVTMGAMLLDRRDLAGGTLASLFIVLAVLLIGLAISLI